MARQLRIEYPGAFYHVFSRGNQKQPIFLSDDDRRYFLRCLRKAHGKFGIIVHVYCLMPNHFHLALETPLGNLSRMMHFLITNYTVCFNKKHDRHGHLFQGRFRSVLVDGASYAQELSRYIHLNPVRSGIVDRPELFPWSSYGYYQGKAGPQGWLETAHILKLFGGTPGTAMNAYREFVRAGIGVEASSSIKDARRKGILGSEEFIERIKREYLSNELKGSDREKPQLRELRKNLDLSQVLSVSERVLGPRNKYLIPIAVLASHENSALKLKEIGEFFALGISSVSNACVKARAVIAGNSSLAQALKEIERTITEADGVKPTFFGKK